MVVLLAVTYYGAARAGLHFSTVGDAVTPIWPPAGIAVFALVAFGARAWPGVAIGAYLVNAPLFGDVAALPVAAGNTAAVVAAAVLLRRRGFDRSFARLRDTFLLLAAASAGMAISATIGTAMLVTQDALPVARADQAWMVWWTGDALGVLLVAPALWAIAQLPRRSAERLELAVTLAGTAMLMLVSLAADSPGATIARLLPLWAAWRFGLAGAAPASLITAAAAVIAALRGWPLLVGDDLAGTMLRVQGLALSTGVASLMVASLRAERNRDRRALIDVNEQLERRVRERTSELAAAQRVARLGSFDWDVPAGHVSWSDELYALLDLDPATADPSLETYLARVHPDERDDVRRRFTLLLRNQAAFSSDHRILAPDGRVRWIHAKTRVTAAGDGSLARIYGTLQDVTERKVAEQALHVAIAREHDAAAQQAELAALRERMLGAVSHELRTPLTVVLGMAATLRRDEVLQDRETAADLVERLHTQAKRLESMLTDLLDLDRLQRGTTQPRPVPVELHALGRHVAARIAPPGHTILVAADDCTIRADASHAERVIENLLRNAIRHTPEGSTIWVRGTRNGAAATLTVEDDGPGVPDDIKTQIFDVFWQKGSPASPGAGVGLSLVAQIARAHEGRAWVTDRAGGGAAFHVEFADRVTLADAASG